MTEEDRIAKILTALQKIEDSGQTVREYYKRNDVPFSRAQYYTYRKTLQNYGEEGLRDKRKGGNYTKLTERLKDYIVSTVKENRDIPSSQLQVVSPFYRPEREDVTDYATRMLQCLPNTIKCTGKLGQTD